MPRVTLGLPVYNGAALIGECLESLAAQTYRDFEVIISDNASNDGTSEICAAFCDRDSRFRHIIHRDTCSANDNFLFVRDIADCDFFAFRAYDDLADPDYLELLVPILLAKPMVRLAVGRIRQEIGTAGRFRMFDYPLSAAVEAGPPAPRILRQMFQGNPSWFYGLWRKDGLVESFDRVFLDYDDPWGSDHLIILHAILADSLRGTNAGATFVQRILPTPRHYIPKKRPSYEKMVARNARFEFVARQLLEESQLSPADKRVIRKFLHLYTLMRCHGAKRLLQARLKKFRKL